MQQFITPLVSWVIISATVQFLLLPIDIAVASPNKLAVTAAESSTRLFSPNGDGQLDATQFHFDVSVRGNDGNSGNGKPEIFIEAEITVYNGNHEVAHFVHSVEAPPTDKGNDWADLSLDFAWGGMGTDASFLADGEYQIAYVVRKIQVTPSGHRNVKDEVDGHLGSIFIDTTPPTLTILCPQNGVTTSSSATAVVGDVHDSSGVAAVTVNGVAATIFGDTFYAENISLVTGDNFITAYAVDNAGNVTTTPQILVSVVVGGGEPTITTWAGNGSQTYNGDNLPAVNASLAGPIGVTVDRDGRLYIADNVHRRVRRVDGSGIITTVAGNGTSGSGGDGGLAINAQFISIQDLAISSDGSLFVVDSGVRKVRKITTDGFITTYAGNGNFGTGGDGGPATSASFSQPSGIAFDSFDNLYIADTSVGRVRVVDSFGIIRLFAGGATNANGIPAVNALLQSPVGVSVTPQGEILITERFAHRVRRVNQAGLIFTLAGTGQIGFSGDGGSALQARFRQPEYAAMDLAGNLWIADTGNNRIRQVNASGIINTAVGTGAAGFGGDGGDPILAIINGPQRLSLDGFGGYFIADSRNHRIRRVTMGGEAGEPLSCLP